LDEIKKVAVQALDRALLVLKVSIHLLFGFSLSWIDFFFMFFVFFYNGGNKTLRNFLEWW
jgi:hypothetical protein